MRRDDERRDATEEIHAELDHVHPHDRPQAADPGGDERHDSDGEDPGGEVPAGDDGQRDGRREDAYAVGERAGEEEDAGGGTPRDRPEAPLEALVGGAWRPLAG